MRTQRKFLAILMALCLMISMMPMAAFADGDDDTGTPSGMGKDDAWDVSATEDDSVTAYLTENDDDSGTYTLHIEGSGAMKDYTDPTKSDAEGANIAPWYSALDSDENDMVPITQIVIGNKITGLGNYAFAYTSVTEVEFMPNVSDYGRNLFYYCQELTTVDWTNFCPKDLKDDSVTNGATGQIVPTSLFDRCFKLANSKLDGVLYEGELVLPDYITGICLSGFYGTAFTTVDLKDRLSNVKSIGPYAFSNSKITSVYIPADVEFYESNSGAGVHFSGCASLTSVTVDENVKKIPQGFFGKTAISSIELGAVTSIGEDAFANCTNLKTVTIVGSDDLVIVNKVFNGTNTPVETFVLENGSVADGDNTNSGLARLSNTLKNLTMSGKTVSTRMFYTWPALENVVLKEGITSIGAQAFHEADSLETIVLPSTLTSIGDYGIQNCNSLKVVDMTAVKSVTLGAYALSKSNSDIGGNVYEQGIIYVSNTNVENAFATQDGKARYSATESAIANTNGGYFEETPTSGTTLAEPVKDGYTFDGWYSSSTFNGSAATTIAKSSTNYPTYYAKWTLNAPTVTVTADTDSVVSGETVTLTAEATHEVEGVELKYTYQWYSGGTEENNKIDGATEDTYTATNLTADTIYYCQVTATDDDNNESTATASDGITIKVSANKGELTLSANSGTVYSNVGTTTFTYNYNGTGEVTVTSSNTDVATATVDATAKNVTVTVKKAGSTTITVSAAATDDHTSVSAEYALTVNTYTPDTSTNSSSGSSSSSSSSTYTVSVDTAKNGTVTVSPKNASKGTTVTITAKPADGYEVDEVIVTDKNGDTVKVTAKGNDKYTFVMPAGKVDVEVTFVQEYVAPAISFTDVKSGAWYYDAAIYAAENGLMSGTGNGAFSPDLTTSRAMIWTILARVDGQNISVTYGNWYDKAQSWAISAGVSDGTNPDNPITREQLAVMLYGFAKEQGYTTSNGVSLSRYVDASDISAWAVEALEWAVGNGLISSMGNNILAPTGTATRAQVAVILMNFCENIAK